VTKPAAQPAARPLTGAALRDAFASAATWLERNAAAIDAINVYPVPDGDTGSNMAATLRDALAGAGAGDGAGAFASGLARAALLSARGNSGVILSQWLRGFADALVDADVVDAAQLASALASAADAAYAATATPQEGTILTVARAAADTAGASSTPLAVVDAALDGARAALAHTPELLPVLKQAGVVDSGGMGLVVLLEGLAMALRGEPMPETVQSAGAIDRAWLDTAAHDTGSRYGYCTEFVVEASIETRDLRAELSTLGDSLLIVAEPPLTHVHLHTDDPGAALSLGTRSGDLVRVKVENMRRQTAQLAARAPERPFGVPLAVVMVVAGDAAAEIARGYGATVVPAEAARNPSVADLLAGVAAAHAERAIILPNHKNVIMAAGQAAATDTRLAVVPTRSLPQGMSALLAFDATRTLDENVDAMRAAAAAVRTIEVTRAARATRIDGAAAPEGTPIALIEGTPRLAAATPLEALLGATAALSPEPGSALTVYAGADLDDAAHAGTEAALQQRFPELEVDVVRGGQQHYDYVAGLE
jgi:DAK2 domain fusion protein YloV